MKRIIAFSLLLALLAGCTAQSTPEGSGGAAVQQIQYDWMAGESPVPSTRSGIHRQGLTYSHFECTENGVYFVCTNFFTDNNTYILYGDHDSDTLIKLCGRADCTHTDQTCNAYLYGAYMICYYDGHLYANTSSTIAPKIVRMDLDGTNRVTVLDTNPFVAENRYSVCFMPMLTSGLFMTYFGNLTSDGLYDVDPFYYKLDDLDADPEPINGYDYQADVNGSILQLIQNPDDPLNSGTFYLWDPETNTCEFLTEFEEFGYYNETQGYYFQNGAVRRLTYATGQEEVLFETGFDGDYRAVFFPDCIVIASKDNGKDADPNLYFYNWAYEFLGTATMDYPHSTSGEMSLLGETANRIILTDIACQLPRYYIEKSDFGTGNIDIHEYNIPDLEEELAAIDEELAMQGFAD